MNYDIYKYLDGQMNDREMKEFEEFLGKDSSLKNDFDKVSGNLDLLKKTAKIEADSIYFNNITANMRSRIETQKSPKRFFYPKFAVALPSLILVFMVSMVFINNRVENHLNMYQIISELDDHSKGELIREYSENSVEDGDVIEIADSQGTETIKSNLIDELKGDTESLKSAMELSYSDLNQELDNLSDNEESEIYNKMINMKIL